jgi:hypothetical protein
MIVSENDMLREVGRKEKEKQRNKGKIKNGIKA